MHLLGALFISCVILTKTEGKDSCDSLSTCNECIRTPSCAWCYDSIKTSNRCFKPDHAFSTNECDVSKIFNPDNELIITSDNDLTNRRPSADSHNIFSSSSGSDRGSQSSSSGPSMEIITQVKPQQVKLKLRPGTPLSIQMYFTQAEDFPMDVYYLVNNGNSMEGRKEELMTLGHHLVEHLQNITSNFRLGLGTTSSPIPEEPGSPCQDCHTSYTFKNEMTLSLNTAHFNHVLNNISMADNLDVLESELDAIMQTLACRHQIGWRSKARHLLIFSPNNDSQRSSKIKNDFNPNDSKCHLDQRGYYTMSSKQVSPNVTQINTQMKENSIKAIFPIAANKSEICHKLEEHLEELTCTLLTPDPSNVMYLIEEQYRSISSTVEMKDNATSAVQVRYFSRCLDRFGPEIETNHCSGLKVGDVVNFRVQVLLVECPTDSKDMEQVIHIYPVGVNESLVIRLTMLCECSCKHQNIEGCT